MINREHQQYDPTPEGIPAADFIGKFQSEKLKAEQINIDLGSITPLIESDQIHDNTGLLADLVATVDIGQDSLFGIMDRRPSALKRGTGDGLIWTGLLNRTDESHALTTVDDLHLVKLIRDPKTLKYDIERHPNDAPIYSSLKPGETVRVGRSDENKINTTDDSTTSRNHLELRYDETTNTLNIADVGSTNGSFVTVDRQQSKEESKSFRDRILTRSKIGKLIMDRSTEKKENKVISIESGLAEKQLKGEDSSLIDNENGLYGVFDGAGGHIGGAEASRQTREVVEGKIISRNLSEMMPKKVEEALKDGLMKANEVVTNNPDAGVTTATILKIHEWQGKKYAVWGSIGDSRLYLFNRAKSTLSQVSDDEGEGKYLFNAIGTGKETQFSQFGYFELAEGDELMLCSDGITGDTKEQLLSDNEIASSMYHGSTAKEAADNLLRISRKPDDKTCIVVR